MSKVIGIDLGLTNSRVAVHENGKARIIASAEGFLATPSVVGYTKHGDCLIGEIAKRHVLIVIACCPSLISPNHV